MSKRALFASLGVSLLFSHFSMAKEAADCSTLTSRTETLNGKQFIKYNVVSASHMDCSVVKASKPNMQWKVKKISWSAEDENAFGNFLKQIGHSKCNTVDRCLAGPSNPIRTEEDLLFTHYSDCADFPYYLRSYFAYKNQLPFAMVNDFSQAPFTDKQKEQIASEREYILKTKGEEEAQKFDARLKDERYSRNGNIPNSKLNVPSSLGTIRDFSSFGPRIMDQISSGTMRMLNGNGGAVESDFYSPAVNRQSIKAGTVLYNVSGHVAIVYDVNSKGEILFIDAHPDNSVTRGVFNPDFRLVKSVYGGNFKNFRPITIQNPQIDKQGIIIKGNVVAKSDNEISDFSLQQYEGDGRKSDGGILFKLSTNDNKGADFYDWVKFRMSNGAYRLDPLFEMQNEVNQICSMSQERIQAVQTAIENKVHEQSHPSKLPNNIFGADGDWEAYSTPSRDIRLKVKVLNLVDLAKSWIARYQANDPLISYNGQNLKLDLVNAYSNAVGSCTIKFKNSLGTETNLPLEKLVDRMGLISFDPYLCPEVRWGAFTREDLNTCQDDQEKREWHALTQFLRNNLNKETDAFHGYSLDQLRQMNADKTVDNGQYPEKFRIRIKLEAL